jgi:hypothetical protein
MPLVTSGRDFIAQAIMNDSATFFSNANAYLAVGDSTTAFNVSQTDLQAATNKLRKGMESGYPQRTDNVLTFRSVFGTADANYSWLEWALFNASSAGTMLTRKVEDLGTKTSVASWVLTASLTVEIG